MGCDGMGHCSKGYGDVVSEHLGRDDIRNGGKGHDVMCCGGMIHGGMGHDVMCCGGMIHGGMGHAGMGHGMGHDSA